MRQKLITLDLQTFEMASKKKNFSEWVRNQLRSERNNSEGRAVIAQLEKDTEALFRQKEYWFEKYSELKAKVEEE